MSPRIAGTPGPAAQSSEQREGHIPRRASSQDNGDHNKDDAHANDQREAESLLTRALRPRPSQFLTTPIVLSPEIRKPRLRCSLLAGLDGCACLSYPAKLIGRAPSETGEHGVNCRQRLPADQALHRYQRIEYTTDRAFADQVGTTRRTTTNASLEG